MTFTWDILDTYRPYWPTYQELGHWPTFIEQVRLDTSSHTSFLWRCSLLTALHFTFLHQCILSVNNVEQPWHIFLSPVDAVTEKWDFALAMRPSVCRPRLSTIFNNHGTFFVNGGISTLYDSYGICMWPLLPNQNLGHRHLLSLRYSSKNVFF